MRLAMPHLLRRKSGYYISQRQFQKAEDLVNDPKYEFLKQFDIRQRNWEKVINLGLYDGEWGGSGESIESISPATGKMITKVCECVPYEVRYAVTQARRVWPQWAFIPMSTRGEIIRQIGDEFRKNFDALARLISLEVGKILPEAINEVQEFIDICDYAVSLSQTLPGSLLPSERTNRALLEKWNPSGVVGVITPFNYPIAAYGWNSILPLVCGNTIVWKPASGTFLTAIQTITIIAKVLERNNIQGPVASLISGGPDVEETLVNNKRVPLISFTGSTNVGRQVALKVHQRFGRSLLELGGNNVLVVAQDADLETAVRAAVFSCIGPAGRNCTTTKTLILHKKIKDEFLERLKTAYKSILDRVGDPLDDGVLYGPLHNQLAVKAYKAAIKKAVKVGGKIEFGGKQIKRAGFYVEPTIISGLPVSAEVMQQETFVPIVYILEANSLEEAIDLNNCVERLLSSSLFTKSIKNAFQWIDSHESGCSIFYVNNGTSSAEIDSVFGGEKATAEGRESGSDVWKHYMRHPTVTINYGNKLLSEKWLIKSTSTLCLLRRKGINSIQGLFDHYFSPGKFEKYFDTVIISPPFGTKKNAGIDMKFLKTPIKLSSNAIYSLHKNNTWNYVLSKATQLGARGMVIAELRYDLLRAYKFHQESIC